MHGSLAADQAAHGPLATDTAVLVLSGLPASGKTRIARWLLSHSPLEGEQQQIVWGRGVREGERSPMLASCCCYIALSRVSSVAVRGIE